ncbi:MAG: hypothetical protein HYT35_00440 [Candidatus Staskawiczbacteria bacterium]|nr:hypothetical protein [Candidatus Staskawiczbacteria bacterium]
MRIIFIILFLIIVIGFVGSATYFLFEEKITYTTPKTPKIQVNKIDNSVKLVDFYKVNPEFLFSAEIPKEFEVEYISKLKAINIYSANLPGENNIEKSQVYISFFKASKFLTLGTVEITQQDKITVKERQAILYEITKKDEASNFSGQPNWRNFKHKALDIRLTENSPSYFYSFAYNPNLSEEIFNNIIGSLVFYFNEQFTD